MQIDLRSDTVTRPSQAMRKAMAEAEVGDDVFGEDPTTAELEREVAELLGKEAALFVPSGCMANQLALNVHAGEGDEVIVETDAHIFNYETTAASFLSRIQLNPVKATSGRPGILTTDDIEPAIREEAYYMPVTRLLALENTHNRAGGTVYSVSEIAELTKFARSRGLAAHLDGARLWNACATTGAEPLDFAQLFDTVAVCFSKGLGAPVGSALCGPQELITKAHRVRKIWGGGMRQSGIIAAGALYALRNNRGRLIEDQEKAATMAAILKQAKALTIVEPESNILLFKSAQKPSEVIAALEEKGVRVSNGAHGFLRIVTHLDVSPEQCASAANTIAEYFQQAT